MAQPAWLGGFFGLCVFVSLATGCASQVAAPQPAKYAYDVQYPRGEADTTYTDLTQRVKAGDLSVDFTVLRLTYADGSYYRPSVQCGDRKAMFQALHAQRFPEALQGAEAILRGCPLDLDAHMASAASYSELRDPGRAVYHRRIVDGLVKSVLDSGDGKSLKGAMTVIDVQEEYVVVSTLGLRANAQGLVSHDGRFYDEMQTTDPRTGRTVTLYFNIDRPMRWANRQLGK